jgi:membrane protein implicated in regulation of membrane protease activity
MTTGSDTIRLEPGNAAFAFRTLGIPVLLASVLFLLFGTVLIWAGWSLFSALGALGLHFFLSPLVFTPLLARRLHPHRRRAAARASATTVAPRRGARESRRRPRHERPRGAGE